MEENKKKKIGLFFGSFNPVHIGHLIIANHFVEHTDLDEVWLIISPQSPFKKKKGLLAEHHRYAIAEIATNNNSNLRVSNIEFKLPKPSYTTHTLAFLTEKYSNKEFVLIMGEDNLVHINKWKNYDFIIDNFSIYVYPRPNIEQSEFHKLENVKIINNVPKMEISSSFIRKSISEGKDVKYLLSEVVYEYITEMNFYKKIIK